MHIQIGGRATLRAYLRRRIVRTRMVLAAAALAGGLLLVPAAMEQSERCPTVSVAEVSVAEATLGGGMGGALQWWSPLRRWGGDVVLVVLWVPPLPRTWHRRSWLNGGRASFTAPWAAITGMAMITITSSMTRSLPKSLHSRRWVVARLLRLRIWLRRVFVAL